MNNKVLIMDLDAQEASTGLGVKKDERENSTYDLLTGKASLKDVVKTNIPSLSIAPASTDLSSIDVDLFEEKEESLNFVHFREREDDFDYILIDRPPSLNLLTINSWWFQTCSCSIASRVFCARGIKSIAVKVGLRSKINEDLKS